MDETIRRLGHPIRVTALMIGLIAMTGCTNGTIPDANLPTTSTSASQAAPTPDVSASIAAALAADEAALPMPVDRIAAWAEASVPQPGEGGAAASFHGWISQTNGPRTSSQFSTLPAGTYSVAFACRGDSDLQADLTDTDGTVLSSTSCTNGILTIPATTQTPGLRISLALDEDGAPTTWAASFTATPAT